MKSILTDSHRSNLLQYLVTHAPDDVLVNAVIETKAFRERLRSDLVSACKYVGLHPTSGKPVNDVSVPKSAAGNDEPALPAADVGTENIEPPGEACSRIGSDTRSYLLAQLRSPKTLDVIGRKYQPHLKLLWKRNEVKYNGKEYHL